MKWKQSRKKEKHKGKQRKKRKEEKCKQKNLGKCKNKKKNRKHKKIYGRSWRKGKEAQGKGYAYQARQSLQRKRIGKKEVM